MSRAKLAPSKINIAGTVIPPRKVVVSRIKFNGGAPLGALGILVPVQPGVSMKSAFNGRMMEHGIAIMTASETGMSIPRRRFRSLRSMVALWTERTGDAGWWKE